MNSIFKSELPLLRRLNRDLEFFDRFMGGTEWPFQSNKVWAPDLEVLERGSEFIVRADVPGLKREEITIEMTESQLTIKGERKRVDENEHDGYYRSERTYGAFLRSIPLPEGVNIDQAKAVVKDGVLEVTMPLVKATPTVKRLEIQEPTATGKSAKHAA